MPLLSSDSARYCVLPARNRPATSQIFLYFGSLTLLIYLATPSGYLVDIATSYMLKNRLHATASQVSMFRLLTGIPAYIALVFGLARDLWSPFGLRDRGYFLCFAPIAAVSFLGMAFYHLSYSGLFLGSLFVTLSFRSIAAAHQALLALIGQQKLMTGRLTTLWQVVSYIPMGASAFISGWVAVHLPPRPTFLLMAALALGIAFLGFWKPASVFRDTYEAPHSRGSGSSATSSVWPGIAPFIPPCSSCFSGIFRRDRPRHCSSI